MLNMGSMYGFWKQLNKENKQVKQRYIDILYDLQFKKLVSRFLFLFIIVCVKKINKNFYLSLNNYLSLFIGKNHWDPKHHNTGQNRTNKTKTTTQNRCTQWTTNRGGSRTGAPTTDNVKFKVNAFEFNDQCRKTIACFCICVDCCVCIKKSV